MASKYDALYKKNELQRWDDESPNSKELQDKIGQICESKTKIEIADWMKHLESRKELVESLLSTVNFEIKAHEKSLVAILESTGESKFSPASGGTFFLQPKPRPSVFDKPAFNEWAKVNGYADKFAIHVKTLEAIVNERLVNGEPLPPGVKAFMDVKIGKRGVKSKSTAKEQDNDE